jgi:hypothetical protein
MKFFSGCGFGRTAAIAAAMTCASTTLALTPSNLKLEAADTTIGVGQKLVVAIKMDGSVSAAGAQFVIAFNSSKLQLDVAGGNAYTLPVGSPMDLEIYESASTGMLKLALGTTSGTGDATISGDIAYLTFTCLEEFCNASSLVSFSSSGGFSTKLTDANGAAVSLGSAENLGEVSRDITAPSMNPAPAARYYWADADGSNKALVGLTDPTGTDSCGSVVVTSDEPADNKYPANADTTVTYRGTDKCGNYAEVSTHVDVAADSLLLAKVGMGGAFVASSFQRGISIRASGASTDSDSQTVGMASAGSSGSSRAEGEANMQIVGNVEWLGACAELRDPKHTLRTAVQIDFQSGDGSYGDRQYNSRYKADAQSDSGDYLVVGNINSDSVIDILDFGSFVANRGANASVNTTVSTQGVHADMNASGVVNNADLSFLAVNFFKVDETCSSSFTTQRPLSRIKVSQLRAMGLANQAGADINGDGWVDTTDMSLMMQGAEPRNTTSAKKPVVDGGVMAP